MSNIFVIDEELINALDVILDPDREVTKQETVDAFEFLDNYRKQLKRVKEELDNEKSIS